MHDGKMLPVAAGERAWYGDAKFLMGPLLNQDVVDQLYPMQEAHEEHWIASRKKPSEYIITTINME